VWQVVRLSAEATCDEGWRSAECKCGFRDPNTGELIAHGEPLWPERWSCTELYALKKADPEVWESSYQQRPSIAGGYWFANVPLNFYEEVKTPDMNVYLLCDPALGREKKHDFTAMWVFGTHADGNYYWLEMLRERLTPPERAEALFRLHRKWRPVGVGYEEYGLMSDTSALREKMERENYRFHIEELGRKGEWHNVSKPDRIRTLISIGTAGRLWLPNPETQGRDAGQARLVKDFITQEWCRYPGSRFDDMLDVMSRMNDPKFLVRFPRPRPVYEPSQGTRPGVSWMST